MIPRPAGRLNSLRHAILNSVLVLVSIVLGLVAVEAAFRLTSGVPLTAAANFRLAQAIEIPMSGPAEYDPLLGWTMLANYGLKEGPKSFSTGALGLRNGVVDEKRLPPGGVLVVGSSFTAGSEVGDEETWPAYLERLIEQPVLNGGVGGYAIDQVALRAEQLLPIVKPKTLIVEGMDDTISWTVYSSRGRPKPYFTIENDRLVLHNSPVPSYEAFEKPPFERLKNLLGHSLVLNRAFAELAPGFWYRSAEQLTARIKTDEVGVTCRLLAELKARTEQQHVRMIFFGHVAAKDVVDRDRMPLYLARAENCAREMQIEVIDAFEPMRQLYASDPEQFPTYYVMHGATFGHNSPRGNERIARLVAGALAGAAAAGRPIDDGAPAVPDGPNLLPRSEELDRWLGGSPVGAIARSPEVSLGRREFRVTPQGGTGEHYVAAALPGLVEGPYALSFEVHPENGDTMRAQLVEDRTGIVCDIDFRRNEASAWYIGAEGKPMASVEPVGEGWYRVSLAGRLAGGTTSLIVQLASADGDLAFAPGAEALTLRAVQLEHGESSTPYRPSDPPRPPPPWRR